MSLEDYTHAVVDFVRAHEVWAAPIVGALAFGESLAFISLLIPAWGALVAIGALIGPGGKNIRALQEETGVTIDVQEDGTVYIASSNAEAAVWSAALIAEREGVGK